MGRVVVFHISEGDGTKIFLADTGGVKHHMRKEDAGNSALTAQVCEGAPRFCRIGRYSFNDFGA